MGPVLGLAGPVLVYCNWLRQLVWICSFSPCVVAHEIVLADPSLRFTSPVVGTLNKRDSKDTEDGCCGFKHDDTLANAGGEPDRSEVCSVCGCHSEVSRTHGVSKTEVTERRLRTRLQSELCVAGSAN